MPTAPSPHIRTDYPAPPESFARAAALGARFPGPAGLPALAAALRDALGLELTLDPDILAGFLTDSSNLPARAEALARPETTAEAALVLHAAHHAGLPVTISAGRSNLTGSATPEGGLILSLARMQQPGPLLLPAIPAVRAPVGLILEDLRQQVVGQSGGRLFFPVDPTSRADATVGGAVACNASGFIPGEQGAMRAWVRALEFLTPDGFRVQLERGQTVSQDGFFHLHKPDGSVTPVPVPRHPRAPIKNAGGPWSAPDGVMDLADLVIGSEGLFGIVTAVELGLARTPRDRLDLFLSLPDEAAALRLRNALDADLPGGIGTLAALEYFGVNGRRFMRHADRLFHGDDPVAVYLQVPLADSTAADAAEGWLDRLLRMAPDLDPDAVMLLDNERDRALFFEARHSMPANAVEVVQHRGTVMIMTDTVVPAGRFAEFLASAHAWIREAGLDCLTFGHLGDCHLHITLLPKKAQMPAALALYDRLVARSAELGGVYSGEHGTGKRKRADFLQCHGPAAAAGVLACKAAFDPCFRLNRGNVIAPPNA